jgi:hypothetical protein
MPQHHLTGPRGHLILVIMLDKLFTKFITINAYFLNKRFRQFLLPQATSLITNLQWHKICRTRSLCNSKVGFINSAWTICYTVKWQRTHSRWKISQWRPTSGQLSFSNIFQTVSCGILCCTCKMFSLAIVHFMEYHKKTIFRNLQRQTFGYVRSSKCKG